MKREKDKQIADAQARWAVNRRAKRIQYPHRKYRLPDKPENYIAPARRRPAPRPGQQAARRARPIPIPVPDPASREESPERPVLPPGRALRMLRLAVEQLANPEEPAPVDEVQGRQRQPHQEVIRAPARPPMRRNRLMNPIFRPERRPEPAVSEEQRDQHHRPPPEVARPQPATRKCRESQAAQPTSECVAEARVPVGVNVQEVQQRQEGPTGPKRACLDIVETPPEA